MNNKLLSFLFLESAENDAAEAQRVDLAVAENLERLFEAAAEAEKGELTAKKTPLAKALGEFGIDGEDLELDSEGFSLTTDNHDRYVDIINVLGGAEAMHKLAEMGWVVAKCGDSAMTAEPAEYRVRFLEITTVDTGDKDKSDQTATEVAKRAQEFATTPMDREDDLSPIENEDGEMGKRDTGVGDTKDGKDPEGKPKGSTGKVEDSVKADADNLIDEAGKAPHQWANWKDRVRGVDRKFCQVCDMPFSEDHAERIQNEKGKYGHRCPNCSAFVGLDEGPTAAGIAYGREPLPGYPTESKQLREMTTTGSMGTVDAGPQFIAGLGMIKKPKPYGKGTAFKTPGQWTVKQPIVKGQERRKVKGKIPPKGNWGFSVSH